MAKELALKAQMNDEINKFSVVRNQLKKIINARNQLEVQLNENKLVKEELDLMEDNGKTFKLIGPALMKIELKEARENVNNRIKYINEELKRHDKTIETFKEQQEKHRETVMKLESVVQQAQAQAQAQAQGVKTK